MTLSIIVILIAFGTYFIIMNFTEDDDTEDKE